MLWRARRPGVHSAGLQTPVPALQMLRYVQVGGSRRRRRNRIAQPVGAVSWRKLSSAQGRLTETSGLPFLSTTTHLSQLISYYPGRGVPSLQSELYHWSASSLFLSFAPSLGSGCASGKSALGTAINQSRNMSSPCRGKALSKLRILKRKGKSSLYISCISS